jgi:hypothetical protein
MQAVLDRTFTGASYSAASSLVIRRKVRHSPVSPGCSFSVFASKASSLSITEFMDAAKQLGMWKIAGRAPEAINVLFNGSSFGKLLIEL